MYIYFQQGRRTENLGPMNDLHRYHQEEFVQMSHYMIFIRMPESSNIEQNVNAHNHPRSAGLLPGVGMVRNPFFGLIFVIPRPFRKPPVGYRPIPHLYTKSQVFLWRFYTRIFTRKIEEEISNIT